MESTIVSGKRLAPALTLIDFFLNETAKSNRVWTCNGARFLTGNNS
jgi:hypothetical protein